MKIAISSEGKDLDSNCSSMFGRCAYFIIAETNGENIKKIKTIENTGVNQRSGAGINAAKLIGNENVNSLITAAVGPKAFDALKEWNIDIYKSKKNVNKENIEELVKGNLEIIEGPNSTPKRKGRR